MVGVPGTKDDDLDDRPLRSAEYPRRMLIDITPRIEPGTTKVWPGDNPPTREVLCRIADGATVDLSTLRTTVHLGAHADAPNHYGAGARGIDEQPLDLYWGPCEVMRVPGRRDARVSIEDLPRRPSSPRVLLATGTFDGFETFNRDFAGLEPALVDHLHDCGVRLVGVDTPSVDLLDDKELLAHRRFLANDMAIVEGLALNEVPEARYELVAMPLRLVGFDGSPVRAVLRSTS